MEVAVGVAENVFKRVVKAKGRKTMKMLEEVFQVAAIVVLGELLMKICSEAEEWGEKPGAGVVREVKSGIVS